MTSATDRLRALLDERGVEWWQSANTLGCVFTRWQSPLFGDEVCAMENGKEGLVLLDHFMTPEQAIDATLGRGTCQVDVLNTGDCAGYECSEYIMHCNACGHEFGHVLYNEDGDVWMSEPPNYCPNCGKRVVE